MSKFGHTLFPSYEAFYKQHYAPNISAERSVAGLSLIHCRQTAGDWSDGASPDLVITHATGGKASGWIDQGAGRFELPGYIGDAVIASPQTPTEIIIDHAHEIRVLAIPYARFCDLMQDTPWPRDGDFGAVHSQVLRSQFLLGLVNRLWDASEWPNDLAQMFSDAALVALGADLLARRETPAQKVQHRGGLAPWQVRRVVEALKQPGAGPWSLKDLSASVGLSPFHFSRMFKQSLGVSPHRYQMRLRVERACELLESTSLSVTEIALEVGYENPQSLARVFGAEMGMSPAAWRRERLR